MGMVVERSLTISGDIRFHAANSKVHLGEFPRGVVALLTKYRDVGTSPAVLTDKLLQWHEHPARAAARIEHAAFEWLDHLDEQADNRGGSVELAPSTAFGGCELSEEIFVSPAEYVRGTGLTISDGYVADEVDDLAEAGLIESLPRVMSSMVRGMSTAYKLRRLGTLLVPGPGVPGRI